MSQSHSSLSNPKTGERVPAGTLTYFRVRNRQRVWELLTSELERSGITQAELCRRIGRDPSRISGIFSAPSNLEIDTLSDVLFGISGAQLEYAPSHPLDEGNHRNFTQPDWLASPQQGWNLSAQPSTSQRATTAIANVPGNL